MQTNPNGSNQYQMDPRQKLCWESYINPKSETFGNATQSALKAGYTAEYANVITTVDWFSGKVRRLNMLNKAEKVLEETLELIAVDDKGKNDASLWKIKQDSAKFIAATQGKNEGYSTRNELTGADGKDLVITWQDDNNTLQTPNTNEGVSQLEG